MAKLIARQSEALANYCIEKANITDIKKIAEIKYGAYFFISALYKLPLMYIPAIIFGVFGEVIISSLVFSVLRFFAGGVHAKTHTGCALAGNFVMGYLPILTTIGINKLGLQPCIIEQIKLIICTISIALISAYAPADLESKPIYSTKRKQIFKVISAIAVLIAYGISLLVNSYYGVLIMVAVILEVLSITPLAYKIFKNKYGNTNKTIAGEG